MTNSILITALILAFIVVVFVFSFVIKLQQEAEDYSKLKMQSKKNITERAKDFSRQLTSKQLNTLIDVLKK